MDKPNYDAVCFPLSQLIVVQEAGSVSEKRIRLASRDLELPLHANITRR